MRRRAYCSGPLFCPEEVAEMSAIATVLEGNGFDTYLPQRDGVEAFVMNAVNSGMASSRALSPVTRLINKAVFAVDLYEIVERCDCLVLNLNGRVPDEGGVVEAAVAFTVGKPVVIYGSTRQGTVGGCDNPVLFSVWNAFPVADEIEKIPGLACLALEEAGQKVQIQRSGVGIPPGVRRTVEFGRRVCGLLNRVQFMKPKNNLLT